MSEDTTQDINDSRSFEERILATLTSIDNRLTTLEERVDRRLQETRPIWEAVQAQLKQMNKKLDVVILDIYDMKTEIKTLDDRVTNLENTRPQ